MKKKIIQREPITEYSQKCSKCPKIIKGYSESQVNYNLALHLKAHMEAK